MWSLLTWALLACALLQVDAQGNATNITGGIVIPLMFKSVNISSTVYTVPYSNTTTYSANTTAGPGAGRRLQQVNVDQKSANNVVYFGRIQLGTTGSICNVNFDTGSSDIILTTDINGNNLVPSGNFKFLNIVNFVFSFFGIGQAGGVLLTDDVELVPGNPATTLPSQAIIAAGKSTFPPTLGLFGLSFGTFSVAMTNPGFQNGISRAILPLTDLSTVTIGGNLKTTPIIGFSKGPITTLTNLPPPFQPVGNPIFSFSLLTAPTVSANPAPGGTLVLGGFDKTQFLGDVYCSNVDTGVGWAIGLDGFTFINADGTPSTLPKTCVAPEKCVALVDSGSTGIEVPSTIFPKIQALIGATFDTTNGFTVPCTVLGTGKLPTLQLRIGGHIYTLTEKNYIQQTAPNVCVSLFQQFGAAFDRTSGAANSGARSLYVLGLAFMRTLPTIFDATIQRERVCLGANPPLPAILKIANLIFTPSTTGPGGISFDIINDFDPSVAFKLTAGTITFQMGTTTSTVQLASAVTVSTSATPGIVSYSVPAPAYGAFTATIDFTSGAGFIKDVDTVPAILQFANQGTSAITTVTRPKSWSIKKPIDGTIIFTAPVNPTVAFSPALGPVSAPILAFPIAGTVSITAGGSALGSVSVSCASASCAFEVLSHIDLVADILHQDVTVTFVPTNTITAGSTDFGTSSLASVKPATLIYPA